KEDIVPSGFRKFLYQLGVIFGFHPKSKEWKRMNFYLNNSYQNQTDTYTSSSPMNLKSLSIITRWNGQLMSGRGSITDPGGGSSSASSPIDRKDIYHYLLRGGAELLTRIPRDKIGSLLTCSRKIVIVEGGKLVPVDETSNSMYWSGILDSSLNTVINTLGVDILSLIKELVDRNGGRKQVGILEWGIGTGRALSDLYWELRRKGLEVRLIGFANMWCREWQQLPPGITVILDEDLKIYLSKLKIPIILVYSHYGLHHLAEGDNHNKYISHIEEIAPFLSEGGCIIHNGAPCVSTSLPCLSNQFVVKRLRWGNNQNVLLSRRIRPGGRDIENQTTDLIYLQAESTSRQTSSSAIFGEDPLSTLGSQHIRSRDTTLIIFDLDGTLYNEPNLSRAYEDARWNFISEKLGINPKEAEIRFENIRKSNPSLTAGEVLQQMRLNLQEWDDYKDSYINPEIYLRPDLRLQKVLAYLSARYTLVIFTHNSLSQTQKILERLGIINYFRRIFTSAILGFRKPNPESFKAIARIMDTSPNLCISIGDREEIDIIPARQAGMQALLVRGPLDITIEAIDDILSSQKRRKTAFSLSKHKSNNSSKQ
ncbi:MAG: HAD family hydrolase, partial [Candidatus Omnitrophica bacterium]|nr:HAD family hydrolase [Candidatus Omnitrophota bacterium]